MGTAYGPPRCPVSDVDDEGERAVVDQVDRHHGPEPAGRHLHAATAQGRFTGMVVMKPALVAGPSGAPQAAVVPVERIRNFLEANYVAPQSGAPGVEAAKASLARVICVRK